MNTVFRTMILISIVGILCSCNKALPIFSIETEPSILYYIYEDKDGIAFGSKAVYMIYGEKQEGSVKLKAGTCYTYAPPAIAVFSIKKALDQFPELVCDQAKLAALKQRI